MFSNSFTSLSDNPENILSRSLAVKHIVPMPRTTSGVKASRQWVEICSTSFPRSISTIRFGPTNKLTIPVPILTYRNMKERRYVFIALHPF